MKLSEFLKKNKTAFAKQHGIPVPVITRFLSGQRGLSAATMAKIVAATGGQVSYEDLVQEMLARRGGKGNGSQGQ